MPRKQKKVIQVLSDYGCKPRVPVDPVLFADENERKHWIEDKGMEVFSLFNSRIPELTVDLFVRYPIPFDSLCAVRGHGSGWRVCQGALH